MTRPPQQDLEAEQATLGAIILDPGVLPQVREIVAVEDFHQQSHRYIFEAILSLADRDEPIDQVTLSGELRAKVRLDEIGGTPYLVGLGERVPVASYGPKYAGQVKRAAHLREAEIAGRLITQAALDGDDAALGEAVERILSVAPIERSSGRKKLSFHPAPEVARLAGPTTDWVVPHYLAAEALTLLVGKIKAGKSTLLGSITKAILTGETFLGYRVKQGRVVWLTEQGGNSFREILRRADLLDDDGLSILFWHETLGHPWPSVAQAAVTECQRIGASTLIVDTLGQFAGLQGDEENSAGQALTALRPLQVAANRDGLAVLIGQHERKSGGHVADAGRGSSAFGGAVDTILALRRPEGQQRPTIRTLETLTRFEGTPGELLIEWKGDATYRVLGSEPDVKRQETRAAVLAALPTLETEAVTIKALLEADPDLKRSLTETVLADLIASGLAMITGEGKRGDPRRYWKPGGGTPEPPQGPERIVPEPLIGGTNTMNRETEPVPAEPSGLILPEPPRVATQSNGGGPALPAARPCPTCPGDASRTLKQLGDAPVCGRCLRQALTGLTELPPSDGTGCEGGLYAPAWPRDLGIVRVQDALGPDTPYPTAEQTFDYLVETGRLKPVTRPGIARQKPHQVFEVAT